jgi:hypothetical protein
VHVTVVEPTANADPLAGVHDSDTGVVPPVTAAEAYVTTAGWPLVVVAGAGETGHVTVGGGMMMVMDGRVGLLHVVVSHAAVASPARAKGEWARW